MKEALNNMKILADVSLPNLTTCFAEPFELTTYQTTEDVPKLLPLHDILLCRSTLNVTTKLLTNSRIQSVATASSGVDHIDIGYLYKQKIPLFDAKGSNARAVADYVMSALAVLKSQGHLNGNKAGVIGVGEVGSRVVSRLHAAGFDVICFDPPKARQDNRYTFCSFTELTTCDLICVHASLHDIPPFSSKNLLNSDFFNQLHTGTIIINAARGGIVNEEALLKTKKSILYCTDVYYREPVIDERIIEFSTLCTPHIAGHTIEAKQAAITKISRQLYQHYQLPIPSPILPTIKETHSVTLPSSNWQDCVLSLYNPLMDTYLLKTAINKKQAFLTQRQAHQNRHDFVFNNTSQLDQQTKLILGSD